MKQNVAMEARARLAWMDVCRGGAILAVIAFHLVTFSERFGFSPPWQFAEVNQGLALYRMPLLVFLSGMLLERSLRKPLGEYIAGKMRGIFWPYFVWTSIYCFSILHLLDPARIASQYLGSTYLWYLAFLTLYYLIALPVKSLNPLVIAGAALMMSFAAPDGSRYGERLFYLMAFFFAGHAATRYSARWDAILQSKWVWGLAPVIVAASAFSMTYNVLYGPEVAWASAAGIVLIAAISLRIAHQAVLRPIAWIGENSLIFYVVHVPVIYLCGWTLGAAGVASYGVFAIVTVLAALMTGAFLIVASRRFSFARVLFVAPKPAMPAPGLATSGS